MFLLAASVAVGQEATPDDDFLTDVDPAPFVDPDPAIVTDVTEDATIEAITDDSAAYYDTVVTIEGTLSNFISPRLFEMREEETFTDSIVLVVNNSSQPFPPELLEGARLRVTGRVQPSYDEYLDSEFVYSPFDPNAAEAETTRLNMIDFVHSGYVPEEFGEHTLFEVLNVENVEVLGYLDLLVIDD